LTRRGFTLHLKRYQPSLGISLAATLAEKTSGQYLRGNFFEGPGKYGFTDRRSRPAAFRAWRIGYSMHFIQGFGA